MRKCNPSLSVRLIGYFLSILFVLISLLSLLFLIAIGSEFTLPFVARDRPSGNGLYDHSDTLGWKLKPNLQLFLESRNGTVLSKTPYFSTNAQGFRSTPTFEPSKRTAIILGDSFAQGYYLSDQESIPWQLANQTSMNIINTGVGAYSSDQELLMLERTISKDIDWVILLLCANDIHLNMENESWGMQKPKFQTRYGKVDFSTLQAPSKTNDGVHSSEATFTAKKNTICCAPTLVDRLHYAWGKFKIYLSLWAAPTKLAQKIREDYKWLIPFENQYSYIHSPAFYQDPKSLHTEWSVTFQIIERMKILSERNGAKFMAVYIPEIAQLQNRDPIGKQFLPQQYFLQECIRLNIDCLDPSIALLKKASNVFVQDDGHLSPLGATILSSEIAHAMRDGPGTKLTEGYSKESGTAAIQNNQVIEFGKGKLGEQFLINVGQFAQTGWGWTPPEAWGAWSEGNRAQIVIPLPKKHPKTLELRVQALTSKQHLHQNVELWINKEKWAAVQISPSTNTQLTIPLEGIPKADRYISVEFRIPKPVSPRSIGLGADDRLISVGILSAQFK